jgi:hypothetical protein
VRCRINRSVRVSWKRNTVVGVLALFSALTGRIAEGRDLRGMGVPDQLGESLKKFRSFHRDASCVVRPMEWSDEREFRRNWLLWVDCSLERGATFQGQQLLAEVNPAQPLGIFASFYKKRLIELTYTLSITSIDELLPGLEEHCGDATNVVRNSAGLVDSITWVRRVASLDVEIVRISAAVADRDFLRLGQGLPGSAVRVRIRFNPKPRSKQ